MPRCILDITLAISHQLPVWPGDPPTTVTHLSGAQEAMPSVSHISLSSHAGTHVDPPAHFIPGGTTVDELSLEILLGPTWVADVRGHGPITAAALDAAAIPAGTTRLLLRTDNSDRIPVSSDFDTDFAALAPDAAGWLLKQGIQLVGIDGPSIELYNAPGEPVHRMLLRAGLVIVEGLALTGIAPGTYQLICLPLRIANGDGAPARAVLIHEES